MKASRVLLFIMWLFFLAQIYFFMVDNLATSLVCMLGVFVSSAFAVMVSCYEE